MTAVSGERFCTDELQCTLCTRHVEKGKRIAVTIVSQPPHRTNHLLLFSTTNRKKDLRRVPAALAAAFSLATTDPEPTGPVQDGRDTICQHVPTGFWSSFSPQPWQPDRCLHTHHAALTSRLIAASRRCFRTQAKPLQVQYTPSAIATSHSHAKDRLTAPNTRNQNGQKRR